MTTANLLNTWIARCYMIPINNSDFAWLVVSDYNQDNNIGFPDELREDILDPQVNDWYYKNRSGPDCVGGFTVGGQVGSQMGCSAYVGSIASPKITAGEGCESWDDELKGALVGGYRPSTKCINCLV